MKRKAKIILLILCTLFLNNLIVNANAGLSGAGNPGNASSKEKGQCTGGYCFGLSPILKFSLVDVSGNTINSLVENYMINTTGSYKSIFADERNRNFESECKYCIRGKIESDKYSDNAFIIEKFPDDISFSQEILKAIIPNSNQFPNFNFNNLDSAIISACDSNGCSITPEYEKIVIYMLEKANIIPYGNTSIDNLAENYKNELSKYRQKMAKLLGCT